MAVELFTNNASTTIAGTVGPTDTTLSVAAGNGTKFPDPGGTGDFFRVVMIKLSTGEWEIAKVTDRTTDSLDFGVIGNRGIEGTTALSFVDGDIIELRPTAGFYSSMATAVAVQTNEHTYAVDTGVVDAYVIALDPPITSYVAGQEAWFKASNANTGASCTLNAGGGADDIKVDGSSEPQAADINVGDIVHVIHDGTNWQMQRIDNIKRALFFEERTINPASFTNNNPLFAKDVSGVGGLFINPDGGSTHQIPLPYNTILTTEWTSAPAGWAFQADKDDVVPVVNNAIVGVGSSSPADTTSDYYETVNHSSTTALNNTVTAAGQSFTGNGGQLASVRFYVSKTGSPTGNAVAKVYAHAGVYGTSSIPTGAALATSENLDVSVLTGSLTTFRLRFPGQTPLTLANGTNYVVVLEYSGGDASNYVNVSIDSSAPTHSGNQCYFDTIWNPVAGADQIFYVSTGRGWFITGLDVLGTTLTIDQIPSHYHIEGGHDEFGTGTVEQSGVQGNDGSNLLGKRFRTSSTGGGNSHDHVIEHDGTWRPNYIWVGRFKYTGV